MNDSMSIIQIRWMYAIIRPVIMRITANVCGPLGRKKNSWSAFQKDVLFGSNACELALGSMVKVLPQCSIDLEAEPTRIWRTDRVLLVLVQSWIPVTRLRTEGRLVPTLREVFAEGQAIIAPTYEGRLGLHPSSASSSWSLMSGFEDRDRCRKSIGP